MDAKVFITFHSLCHKMEAARGSGSGGSMQAMAEAQKRRGSKALFSKPAHLNRSLLSRGHFTSRLRRAYALPNNTSRPAASPGRPPPI